jgi:hypothetical protein
MAASCRHAAVHCKAARLSLYSNRAKREMADLGQAFSLCEGRDLPPVPGVGSMWHMAGGPDAAAAEWGECEVVAFRCSSCAIVVRALEGREADN